MAGGGWIRAVRLEADEDLSSAYPFSIPAVAALRAESFFNVATEVERLGVDDGYGTRSLHEQSHGESFLSLALHRFGPHGLYLMDEPEAALSPQGCLSLLRRIHELVCQGGQFVIATHSPLLIAYPHATVYELSAHGIERVAYAETSTFGLYEAFLAAPERFVDRLLDDT